MKQGAGMRFVFHDEHPLFPFAVGCFGYFSENFFGVVFHLHHHRNAGDECAALTVFADNKQRSAVKFRQFFCDGETKSGPFDLFRALIRLLKRLKQCRNLLFADADAEIADAEFNIILSSQRRENDRSAAVTELDRIRHQIEQNLLHPHTVGDDVVQFLVDLNGQRHFFRFDLRLHDLLHPFKQIPDADRCEAEVEFPRFDFGKIENVVNEVQQMRTARFDRCVVLTQHVLFY